MPLVWVTGISGAGKSTVCEILSSRGIAALDADTDGFSRWVVAGSGEPVVDSPDPTRSDWLDSHAWHIHVDRIRTLRADSPGVTFLFGAVANEGEVRDQFDRVGCIVVDDETVRQRLTTRTTNAFGRQPADLERILGWNQVLESSYRRTGAAIIDGTRPVDEVAEAVLQLGRGLAL